MPSTNTAVDVCQYPRESPSFCADDWFQYFCPISCKHINCTEIWATFPPTPLPTLMTTTFQSTEISTSPTIQIIDTTSSTMDSIDTDIDTTKAILITTDIKAPINGTDRNTTDMSLILILLAVLLACIFFAAILLWICMNIVRLQKDKNNMRYNTMAAMATSSRTPDYIHAGYAPSTPDYCRTDIHHHKHEAFRMKG